jgi:hypothetical protein
VTFDPQIPQGALPAPPGGHARPLPAFLAPPVDLAGPPAAAPAPVDAPWAPPPARSPFPLEAIEID